MKFNSEYITFCDKGLKWLSILPQDNFYCITAMMNETNRTDDMDELKEALFKKDITERQFKLATHTSNELKTGLLNNIDFFINYTQKCYTLIQEIDF